MRKMRGNGFVSNTFIQAVAVVIVLGTAFYFFSPTLYTGTRVSSYIHLDQNQDGGEVSSTENAAISNEVTTLSSGVVYFNNSQLSKEDDCSDVFPVDRRVNVTNPAVGALLELLKGPTDEEKSEGYSSPFSEKTAFSLEGLSVRDGVAAVNLADLRSVIPSVSSSCGSRAFVSSVEETLKQFADITKVIFAIDGSPRVFYNWIQVGCSKENNNCDSSMFK